MGTEKRIGAKVTVLRAWWDRVWLALAWRYLSHSLMLGLALLNELRPAPQLPDTVLSLIPYVAWVDRHNYTIWLVLYFPLALWLWRRDRDAFVHFLYVGGLLSLVRGLCIGLTGLGPVHLDDVNVGLSYAELWQAWLRLVNPLDALMSDAPHVYLTKDLFFSGHTATTFLLWLYCRKEPGLGLAALLAHVVVVASVFFAHLHYTIDVVGAWAITGCVFVLARRIGYSSSRSRVAMAGPDESGNVEVAG